MTMPSVTICEATTGNVLDMIDFCILGSRKQADCLQDNFTIYSYNENWANKKNCLRLNFGNNDGILQNTSRAGLKYGYYLSLYIPLGAYVYLGVTDNNILAVDGCGDDISEYVIPGQVNVISMSKYSQKSLPMPFSDCVKTFSYSTEASQFDYR